MLQEQTIEKIRCLRTEKKTTLENKKSDSFKRTAFQAINNYFTLY